MLDLNFLRRGIETLAICLVAASVQLILVPAMGWEVSLTYSLAIGSIVWLTIEAGRRLAAPRGANAWPRGWRGLVLVVMACLLGYVLGSSIAAKLLGHPALWTQDLSVIKTSLLVTVLAGVGASAYFYSQAKGATLQAAKESADRLAVQSQLQRLSSQLQPHMLFNTLANLRALITTQPELAVAMLDQLNAFLRINLKASRQTLHTLDEEIQAIEAYLSLMRVRLGDRLAVVFEIPDDLKSQLILTLLTQPLVENAILHGIEPCVPGGTIWIRAERQGDTIQVAVINTGMPLDPAAPPTGNGIGQALVKERLRREYGESTTYSLASGTYLDHACTITKMTWPLNPAI